MLQLTTPHFIFLIIFYEVVRKYTMQFDEVQTLKKIAVFMHES